MLPDDLEGWDGGGSGKNQTEGIHVYICPIYGAVH